MSKVNLKDKHLRYGGYGALLTLIVIAITLVFNIVITDLNLKIDMTSEGIYSLSDSTKEVVASISDPVNIYVLEETGNETALLKEVLTNYTKLNNNLTLIYKDPVLYPTFGSSYLERSTQNIKSLSNSTVIIENQTTGKFKIIPPTEFVAADETTGNQITLENAITNALGYVMNTNDGGIYYTTGHNELDLPAALTESIDRANLESKSINLLTEELPDPTTSALLINSPHSDFTEEEVNKIMSFLSSGGKAMIFLDADSPELTNFNEVLDYYGISHEIGIAIENNSSYMSSASPAYLIPARGEHEIIDNISSNSASIIVPISSGLNKLTNARSTVTLTPLLGTSNDSFLKKDITSTTLAKEEGDVDGPIVIACAIEDSASPDTKLFVMANSYFLTTNYLNVSATGNSSFINSTLGWLFSLDTSYAIEAKTQDIYQIRALSSTETILIQIIAMVIIPLIVIITGITVWVRRRHL